MTNKQLRPSKAMWVVVPPAARTLSGSLGFVQGPRRTEDQAVGTYFVAAYYQRKFAKQIAAQWRGARVVKVRITPEPRA